MKTTRENGLRKIVRDLFRRRPRSHATWVESHLTALGAPDVQYCVEGVEGWLELKYGDDSDPGEIRAAQVIWMGNRIEAGGRPLILCQKVNVFYVAGGWAARALRKDMSQQNWERLAAASFNREQAGERLFELLTHPEKCYD